MKRIDTDLLTPKRGELLADATVVIDGSSIAYAGSRHDALGIPCSISVPCLMAGLRDCHAQVLGTPSMDLDELAMVPTAVLAARRPKGPRCTWH